jgi:hypothetical protein
MVAALTPAPDFDRVARPYRWLEYLSLGPMLLRARTRHLARLAGCREALILGDGDGRFTARLLDTNTDVRCEAVDLSRVMLALLRRRCEAFGPRLTTHCVDARLFEPKTSPDLVVTHFFLDCLPQTEVDALVERLTPKLAPHALWLVSDFRIPPGAVGGLAWLYVRLLYVAFRLLTNLRVTRLPDHAAALRNSGFVPIAVDRTLFGMLTTELWRHAD